MHNTHWLQALFEPATWGVALKKFLRLAVASVFFFFSLSMSSSLLENSVTCTSLCIPSLSTSPSDMCETRYAKKSDYLLTGSLRLPHWSASKFIDSFNILDWSWRWSLVCCGSGGSDRCAGWRCYFWWVICGILCGCHPWENTLWVGNMRSGKCDHVCLSCVTWLDCSGEVEINEPFMEVDVGATWYRDLNSDLPYWNFIYRMVMSLLNI